MTLERQKLRAEALANEFGALVEYAARKVLGMLQQIVGYDLLFCLPGGVTA